MVKDNLNCIYLFKWGAQFVTLLSFIWATFHIHLGINNVENANKFDV